MEPWKRRLADGEMRVALTLCSIFNGNHRGRLMQADSAAEVRLASSKGVVCRNVRLLHRVEHDDAGVFIWLGDGDDTVYVAFSPLNRITQFVTINRSQVLVKEVLQLEGATECSLNVVEYFKRNLDKLCGPCGLNEKLDHVMAAYPSRQLLFVGISLGAVYAQMASLRLVLAHPAKAISTVTWNSMRWTDAEGAALVHRVLGKEYLSIILSRQDFGQHRRWDGLSEWPFCCALLPCTVLCDVDTGDFLPYPEVGDLHGHTLRSLPAFVRTWSYIVPRALELHFAGMAFKAMRAGDAARRCERHPS